MDEVSSSVNLVVAQRLVRTLCTSCDQTNSKCELCYGTGWGGRAAVMEALLIDEALVELLSGPVPPSAHTIRNKHQILRFADHAKALVDAGRTTAEEAKRVLGPAAGYDF